MRNPWLTFRIALISVSAAIFKPWKALITKHPKLASMLTQPKMWGVLVASIVGLSFVSLMRDGEKEMGLEDDGPVCHTNLFISLKFNIHSLVHTFTSKPFGLGFNTKNGFLEVTTKIPPSGQSSRRRARFPVTRDHSPVAF